MPGLAGLINCLQDRCGLSSESNAGYLFADDARIRYQGIPHTTPLKRLQSTPRWDLSDSKPASLPCLAASCLAIIAGTEIVFSSAPWSWHGPVYIIMLAGYSKQWDGPESGGSKQLFIHTKAASVKWCLSQNCTDSMARHKNVTRRLNLFDVGWCWPKNGCLRRHRGRDGPGAVSANIWLPHTWAHIGAWSVPGDSDHPRLVTIMGVTSLFSPEAVYGGRAVSCSCVPASLVISCGLCNSPYC